MNFIGIDVYWHQIKDIIYLICYEYTGFIDINMESYTHGTSIIHVNTA